MYLYKHKVYKIIAIVLPQSSQILPIPNEPPTFN